MLHPLRAPTRDSMFLSLKRNAQLAAGDLYGERHEAIHEDAVPSGWFVIARSDELRRGDVSEFVLGGQTFVLFRGRADGVARVVSGFCSHMGASLALGTVKADTLVCPMHGWSFEGSGACAAIPYCTTIPARSKLRSLAVEELGGVLLVRFGPPSEESVPDSPAFQMLERMKDYRYYSRDEFLVRVPVAQLFENIADDQHFRVVHSKFGVSPSLYTTINDMIAPWEPSGTGGRVVFRATPKLLDRVTLPDRIVTIKAFGPSMMFIMTGHADDDGEPKELVSQLNFIPVSDSLTCVVFYNYTADSLFFRTPVGWITRSIAAALGRNTTQLEFDIIENGRLLKRPLLVPEDGRLMKFRKWYRQFYPQQTTRDADTPPLSAEPTQPWA